MANEKNIRSIDDLQEELQNIAKEIASLTPTIAFTAMEKAITYIHEEVPDYPHPNRLIGWLKMATPKARRWFFWAVKQGQVSGWRWVEDERGGHPEGHYIRTNTLGRSITSEAVIENNSVIGALGTNIEYAPWVIGPSFPGEQINGRQMYQSRVHEGRWYQLYDIFEQSADRAWEIFDEEFIDGLQAAFSAIKD